MFTPLNSELINKTNALPDLTANVTATEFPSLLITSPDDRRIDRFAESQSNAFIVKSDGSVRFVVVVNPKLKSGFLWWRKVAKLVFSPDRWISLHEKKEDLTAEEKKFLIEL